MRRSSFNIIMYSPIVYRWEGALVATGLSNQIQSAGSPQPYATKLPLTVSAGIDPADKVLRHGYSRGQGFARSDVPIRSPDLHGAAFPVRTFSNDSRMNREKGREIRENAPDPCADGDADHLS